MTTNLQTLPVALSTFHTLRTRGYLYVDKTRHAYKLITSGDRRFFLSRPRRFGKSLLVSMLKEVLVGNRELFNGLWIDQSDYTWQKHGVITLDLSLLNIDSLESFRQSLCYRIESAANLYEVDISLAPRIPEILLEFVVLALHKKFKRVAILVDEYDSPILKALHAKDLAIAIRDSIRSFFTALKGFDEYIDFVFITGVSAFAKAGLFSGMNNLQIITMREDFADICGYTESELDTYFNEHMKLWAERDNVSYAQQRNKIRAWYNGYRFTEDAEIHVYNPFSLMNALKLCKFKNFWISSGTPTFLIEELKKQQQEHPKAFEAMSDPTLLRLSENLLDSFDIGSTPLSALMFQAGYLTIVDYDRTTDSYQLWYPNYEVERALRTYWLSIAAQSDISGIEMIALKLHNALKSKNIDEAIEVIKQLFASQTYQTMPKAEREYQGILQAAFTLSGTRSHAEYSTSEGRADIIVELEKITYVVEVKLDVLPKVALAQIKDRRYYERFLKKGHEVILLGISFMHTKSGLDIQYKSEPTPF